MSILKKALVASALVALTAATSMAAIVTDAHSLTYDCGTAGTNFAFAKFNTNLGTLTGVKLTASGYDTGSFTIQNNLGTPSLVTQPKDNFVTLNYVTEGSSGYLAINKKLTTTTAIPVEGYSIGGNQSLSFTLSASGNSFSAYSDTMDSSRWFNYVGAGNTNFVVSNDPQVTTSGGFYTANTTGVLAHTTLTLTYTYDNSTAVPEPGQVAASALVLLGAGGLFLRRRMARQ